MRDTLIETSTDAKESITPGVESFRHVRLFPASLDTLNLQIRSEGVLTRHGKVARRVYSTARLGRDEAKQLVEVLQGWLSEGVAS